MAAWQKNLISLWLGCFITGLGTSQILPFLPLYISHLGNYSTSQLTLWSGVSFSITFLVSAIVSPLWGKLADKRGRKLMLIRAAVGMAIAITCQGFAQNVWQLCLFRGLMGLASGYIPNAMALIASQAPKGRSGFALSMLSTAQISGFLCGPLLGGYLADHIGLRPVFFVTTVLLVISTIVTLLMVKEERLIPTPLSKNQPTASVWKQLPATKIMLCLLFSTLAVQLCNGSVNPILYLYVEHLSPDRHNLAFLSGIIAAMPGLSALITAPIWGKISDRFGAQWVIISASLLMVMILIAMSWVSSVWQFSVTRLLLGLADGAMFPAIQTYIIACSSPALSGRLFGYNQSFMNLGNVLGPLVGALTSSYLGMEWVFTVSALIMLINLALFYLALRSYSGSEPTISKPRQ